jgi:hypothetical protein
MREAAAILFGDHQKAEAVAQKIYVFFDRKEGPLFVMTVKPAKAVCGCIKWPWLDMLDEIFMTLLNYSINDVLLNYE